MVPETFASVGAAFRFGALTRVGVSFLKLHARRSSDRLCIVRPSKHLTKFAPVLFLQVYIVLLGSYFDAFPGGVAFRVGHPLHLFEAGDCVPHVSRVMDGFLTLFGESEILIGDMIAASFSDFRHNS
jgi:hypothetical protein